MQHPFIIDCDTGRDDALTLLLARRWGMPLVGVVASYGNTALSCVCTNTARILALAGASDVPLFAGAQAPLHDHALYAPVVLARHKTTGNGLCNLVPCDVAYDGPKTLTVSTLAARIDELVAAHGKLHYFVIGPATNLAALRLYWGEAFAQRFSQITMMGGKLDSLWDEMPGADFNIAADPEAVSILMKSGVPMRFLPMNATWPIKMDVQEIEALRPTGPTATFVKELMVTHCRHFAPEPVFRFHDPTILLTLSHAEAFVKRSLAIGLDESSPDFGRLTDSADGTPCDVFTPDEPLQALLLTQMLEGLGLASSA